MTQPDTAPDERDELDEETALQPPPPAPPKLRERFMDAAGTAFGITTGIVAAALIAVIAVQSAGGVSDILDQDQYQDRLDALAAVHRQGIKARQAMERTGISLTDEVACADAFQHTGAATERSMVANARGERGNPDHAFNELRKQSFINGCLGRPNNLPSTPLSSITTTPAAGN